MGAIYLRLMLLLQAKIIVIKLGVKIILFVLERAMATNVATLDP